MRRSLMMIALRLGDGGRHGNGRPGEGVDLAQHAGLTSGQHTEFNAWWNRLGTSMNPGYR